MIYINQVAEFGYIKPIFKSLKRNAKLYNYWLNKLPKEVKNIHHLGLGAAGVYGAYKVSGAAKPYINNLSKASNNSINRIRGIYSNVNNNISNKLDLNKPIFDYEYR